MLVCTLLENWSDKGIGAWAVQTQGIDYPLYRHENLQQTIVHIIALRLQQGN